MKKKVLAAAAALVLSLASCGAETETALTPNTAPALFEEPVTEAVTTEAPPEQTPIETPAMLMIPREMRPHIQHPCKAAALWCIDDEKQVYIYNYTAYTAPASLTKLLTSLVMLNYLDPDEIVSVGSEITMVQPYSSLSFLANGQKLRVRDLIKAMLMCSGNDAAYTAAVNTARAYCNDYSISDQRAVEIFVGLMNDYAAKLKMYDSRFVNPEGWDDDDQRTTTADLVKLADHAYKNPVIREAGSTQSEQIVLKSGEMLSWTNTNLLLDPTSRFYMPEAVGLKTGTTGNAGKCLISVFKAGGKSYISVEVGAETDEDRFLEAHSARTLVDPNQ